MKNLLLVLIIALASCGARPQPAAAPAAQAPANPIYGYRVVAAYPHDPNAFTQGLLYLDGFLYEGTGMNGRSSVRKVDLETGEVLQKRDLPEAYFGEGIVDWNGRLHQLTWQSQKGFIYDLATFEPIREWSYPGEGWGLARNETHIIMSDGTAQLRFLNPDTLAETHRVTVTFAGQPVGGLNELEWIKGEVWANVWTTDFIVRINPSTGQVVGRIDLTGLLPPEERARSNPDVLNGIAYDAAGDRIFVTGKQWPKLYEIRLTGP